MTSAPSRRPSLDETEGPLTVREVAMMRRVSDETVRIWLRDGRLKGVGLGAPKGRVGGHPWRIPRSELEKLDLEI